MLRRLVLSLLVCRPRARRSRRARGRVGQRRPVPAGRRRRPRVRRARTRAGRRIEWRTNAYGPGGGDTRIQRRTLFTVFAKAGRADPHGVVVDRHGQPRTSRSGTRAQITDTEAAALPPVVDGTNGFSCAAHRPTGEPRRQLISTRAQELARAQSVDGTQNTAGYVPCVYIAPTTGPLPRRVLRLGGSRTDAADGTPGPAPRPGDVPGRRRDRRSTPGTSPSARRATSQVDDIPGPRLHLRARGASRAATRGR